MSRPVVIAAIAAALALLAVVASWPVLSALWAVRAILRSPEPALPPPSAPARAQVGLGELGILEAPGAWDVLLATGADWDEVLDAWSAELLDALSTDDPARVAPARVAPPDREGRTFSEPRGAKVRVEGQGWSSRGADLHRLAEVGLAGLGQSGLYVRVVEGVHVGRSGWVRPWSVKRLPDAAEGPGSSAAAVADP
jgi:hypothetical protein